MFLLLFFSTGPVLLPNLSVSAIGSPDLIFRGTATPESA
jgi:hypothetical protein